MPYPFLADVVLLVHFGIALFVVGGLPLIVAGNVLSWRWVNRLGFRLAHLAAIAVVVAESWLGITCPLTTLESWLREQAGSTAYAASFVEHWFQRLLFYQAPGWVFGAAYTLFALLVAATWWYFPPSKITRARSMPPSPEVRAIRPDVAVSTRQRLPYFVGISGTTAGSQGLSMHLVVIPPGARAEPHVHVGYETGIFVLEGQVLTRWGADLEHEVVSQAGEFLFVPPGVPHEAVNLSTTDPARAVIARNDPAEQDKVEPYLPRAR